MKKSVLFFLLIIITFFISCETQEDILNPQNNTTVIYNNAIRDYLEKIKLYTSTNDENNKKINTLIKAIDYSDIKYYDFQSTKKMLVANIKNLIVYPNAVQTKVIFIVSNEKIISSRLVTINYNLNSSFDDKTIMSVFNNDKYISGYSGTISFYNLFQRTLLTNQYENGELIMSKKLAKASNTIMSKSLLCVDWYLVTTYQDGSRTYEYQYTTCDDCSLDEIFESLCNSDGGGTGGDAYQEIEDNINNSKLDPCSKAIMDQLKYTTNNDIAEILKKFGANSIYKVDMKMGSMQKPGNFAETTTISKNNYLITVTQNDFTSATKLFKATALLHETIHAYMLSVVEDYNTYPNNAPFADFPELFNIYVSKINNVTNAVYAQHEDMANKYVNAIASALEEYQANTGIPSSLADKQVFSDMAWSGLRGTDVYNNKFPTGGVEDNRIKARIGAEQSNGNSAIGKPCN